jgi:hypothetical protein
MTTEKKIVREYSYEDETGKMLFQVLRYEPKGFSQRRPASFAGEAAPTHSHGNWIYNTNGVRKVLYKLPELIATPLTEMVFIVEGEKDVERLMSLGIPATTNPGGAGKWLAEFNEYFRGRHVAILQDNDEPGRKHAAKVAESLYPVAASVRVVELPQLPEKGDVSDWLREDNDSGKLLNLALDAPLYKPEEPWTKKLDVANMADIKPLEIEWLWPGRIPLGMLTLLAGDPGLGKSFLSLYMAALMTKGGAWPDPASPKGCAEGSGTTCPQGEVLLLSVEDSLEYPANLL